MNTLTQSSPDHVEHTTLEFKGTPVGYTKPLTINKTWGHELVHINTPRYCCKTLHINRGQTTSCHFHINKHETMVVTEGILYVRLYNTSLFSEESKSLFRQYEDFDVYAGDSFVIAPGMVHQLMCSWEDQYVKFIECSTFSEDIDSHRIYALGKNPYVAPRISP